METIALHGPRLGVGELCEALAVPRATYYRRLTPPPATTRPTPPRALSSEERQEVLAVLHEPHFVDLAPAQVHAQLLDEGRYLCSERTMYRILAANAEVKERRNQLRHPEYKKPELLATGPNEVWSWDITKLLGPQKWTYFYLYVVIDIFSRYVVGWMLADTEDSSLARKLIGECCARQGIEPGQLTVHADRGTSMTSKALALLYADLGVTKTHSRPCVSALSANVSETAAPLEFTEQGEQGHETHEPGRGTLDRGVGESQKATVHRGVQAAHRQGSGHVQDAGFRRRAAAA